jgi:hypothetical protein
MRVERPNRDPFFLRALVAQTEARRCRFDARVLGRPLTIDARDLVEDVGGTQVVFPPITVLRVDYAVVARFYRGGMTDEQIGEATERIRLAHDAGIDPEKTKAALFDAALELAGVPPHLRDVALFAAGVWRDLPIENRARDLENVASLMRHAIEAKACQTCVKDALGGPLSCSPGALCWRPRVVVGFDPGNGTDAGATVVGHVCPDGALAIDAVEYHDPKEEKE